MLLGGAGGFACHFTDSTSGRRNRLPHRLVLRPDDLFALSPMRQLGVRPGIHAVRLLDQHDLSLL